MTISSTKFQARYGVSKPFIKPTAKPFLKWAGGKAGLLDSLIPLVPQDFNDYFEPFLGGGALFFALQNRGIFSPSNAHFKRAKNAIISDKNTELINAYSAIQSNPHKVLRELKSL